MKLLTSGSKVITKTKDAAGLGPFFESMLTHLITGTISVKTGEL